MRSLRPGDTVRLGHPVGDRLVLPDAADRDLLMVAGGTGLAPFRAVLEQIDRDRHGNGNTPAVHLFHGARMPWDLYERELLNHLASRPWFTYTEVVSDDQSYPGVRGLVGTVAAREGNWRGRLAMVCGSAAMVNHTVTELTAAGMPRDDIRIERWVATDDGRQAQPEAEQIR